MSDPRDDSQIEVTLEMVRAAEREIERCLAYSTEAAAIDVEAVLIAALRAKKAAARTAEAGEPATEALVPMQQDQDEHDPLSMFSLSDETRSAVARLIGGVADSLRDRHQHRIDRLGAQKILPDEKID